MIAKKNSGHDLESKRSAFFTLGLMVTGSLTLAAFTYSDPMMKVEKGRAVAAVAIDMVLEPEQKEKPEPKFMEDKVEIPQEQPQQQATLQAQATVGELINVTSSTSTVTSTSGVSTAGIQTGLLTQPEGGLVDIDLGTIEEWVDIEASFIGGAAEMKKFITNSIDYPQICIEGNIEGTVFVAFVVEKDGSISNIEIVQGVDEDLDREAKRVVREFPNWNPGEIKAKKVRTRVRLPIAFKLD